MNGDKAATLIGFAIRAGKVVIGSDAIERRKKKKYLLVICGTLSRGSAEKLMRATGVPTVLVTEGTLGEKIHREGCKALLITDKQMSDAVLNNMNGSYRLITEVK